MLFPWLEFLLLFFSEHFLKSDSSAGKLKSPTDTSIFSLYYTNLKLFNGVCNGTVTSTSMNLIVLITYKDKTIFTMGDTGSAPLMHKNQTL